MTPSPATTSCAECKLQAHCLPAGLDAGERDRIDSLMSRRIRIQRGEALYGNGDTFVSLYTVRTGFFKTSVCCDSGREQVTGFQMAGEILGLDGILTGQHQSDAVALEDAEVCAMRFDRLELLSREIPAMQHHLHQLMSREIVRDHGMMLLLGGMRAEERLASFLLNLAGRLQSRGFSANEFVLRMTREEIGSYLGLKLETISRAFSRLAALGIIEVQQKHIRILDLRQLEHVEQEEALAA